MFGSSRNPTQPKSFGHAGAMMRAMLEGKDEQARRDVGASLCPWLPALDAFVYEDRGSPFAFASSMPMAAALARFGDLAALQGVASREDFFLPVPHLEDRLPSPQHSQQSIAMSCALEAISRGRLDLLDALAEAGEAREREWASRYAGERRPWRMGSDQALEISRLDSRSAEMLARRLAFSPAIDPPLRLECLAWISKRAVDPQGLAKKMRIANRLPEIWANAAAESGQAQSVEAALSLGTRFNSAQLAQIARHGLFEWAAKIAPTAAEGGKDPDYAHRTDTTPSSVCELMGGSWLSSLDRIADALVRQESATGSREITWADFCDDREKHHAGALLALRGAFDSPQDLANSEALEAARDTLASAARALASACPPAGEPLDPQQIDELRPNAPATCQELIFLARVGSARLAKILTLTQAEEGDAFARQLFKHYRDVLKYAEPRGEPGSVASESSARMARHLDTLEKAVFALSNAASCALSEKGQEELHGSIASVPGLLQRIEARALDEASMPATRAGRPLKV